MTESPNLEEMESADYLDGESEKEGVEKISVSQQNSNIKSDDNYVVDMERFSHFIHEKDMSTANSRITLQKNLSRKGLGRGEKKFNPTTANERDASRFTTSPKGCTPEKPIIVGVGSTDNSTVHHHQITITNGSISTTNNNTEFGRKRLLSFRRSHSTFIDPKMILLFFATLSSMGTILLIYFTLSMTKLKDEDDGSTALN